MLLPTSSGESSGFGMMFMYSEVSCCGDTIDDELSFLEMINTLAGEICTGLMLFF